MNLERERPLRHWRKKRFDLAAIHFPHVNASGCVKVLTNFYSVPVPVRFEVQAKVHSSYVEIWHQGHECVALARTLLRTASRKYSTMELLPRKTLTKKPGALAGSTPLEQWRAQETLAG